MKAFLLVIGVIGTFCVPTAPALSLIISLPCLGAALLIQVTEEGRR